MAASCSNTVFGVLPISLHSQARLRTLNFSLNQYQFLSSNSISSLRTRILLPPLQIKGLRKRNSHAIPVISASQSNFFRVIQTVIKVGKDGIEAGTNLVPDGVPRPIARLGVTIAATGLSLFVVRSFVSTVFFALGVMGFVYFVYLALNKDKGPKLDESSNSTDEAIEEAKKIMDKYK